MIEYGDIKSKLGQELDIYSQESWETFLVSLIGQHNGSSRLFFSGCCGYCDDLCCYFITNLSTYGRCF